MTKKMAIYTRGRRDRRTGATGIGRFKKVIITDWTQSQEDEKTTTGCEKYLQRRIWYSKHTKNSQNRKTNPIKK